MISTKELRRGNMVAVTVNVGYGETHRKETRFWTISSIGQFHVQYKEFRCVGCKPKPCEGIELNEEWLIKFGFKEIKEPSPDLWWTAGTVWYCEWENNNMGSVLLFQDNVPACDDIMNPNRVVYLHKTFSYRNGVGVSRKIKYVHQLQNLFFALTGTELIISDK